jgi:GDSL-like Lipase/Acylhydrolase family
MEACMFGRRRLLTAVVTATLAGVLAVPTAATASAHPASGGGHRDHRPSAVVSLGDSYISGEAGRWKGNAATSSPGRLGTDRAWRPTPGNPAGVIDRSLVYDGTVVNGCHRSDVAPIVSAHLPFRKAINLACSGARTVNVLRASAGGVGFKGEAPQDDQLAAVARTNDVKMVVLAIGGNDLGFGSIVGACVSAYLAGTAPCSTLQPQIEAGLPAVAAAVGATVDDIRATMKAAGYRTDDYRLVLESYPAPSPAADKDRYSGSAPDARASVGGCPFLDADVAWSHSTLSPAISSTLAGVAAGRRVQFLDLTDAFRGHELCASAAQQSTGRPTSASSEWIRFVDLGGQGDSSESLHPNYFGQQALGRCLALATLTRHDVACHGVPRLPSRAVYLTRAH